MILTKGKFPAFPAVACEVVFFPVFPAQFSKKPCFPAFPASLDTL